MDKRYQVFVSSTYEDLREERQEVMHALLELDCMPAGMELFPAANEDQWTLIKKVIDECDYYIVISSGRYGSLGPHGLSYTEMEYRYAVDAGKPVIAFLHKNPLRLPAGSVEQTDAGKAKLEAFRELLQQKMCKLWETPAELGSVVSRSLVRLTKTAPAVGWIRADEATEALAAPEVLRLRKRIEDLEGRLQEARTSAPPGTEKLAQGAEEYQLDFTFDTRDAEFASWSWNWSINVSWEDIFYDVGPLMLNEASDTQLRVTLNGMVRDRSQRIRSRDKRLKGHTAQNFKISDHDFHTIKIQLRALGLISKSLRPRSIKDTGTYWTLTPYGDQVLTTLRAIPSDADGPGTDGEDEADAQVETEA
ncbi:MAG: DUF4062 domain-containing protein [Vicinamibacterales bacterium]